MSWKLNDDDKIVRQYYGNDGWTYVLRTKDDTEYHISREQIIKNNYPTKTKSKYAKSIYKNIYMK